MISHDINCFDDVCIANKENAYVDKVYVLQKNEKLIFCKVAGVHVMVKQRYCVLKNQKSYPK
jgi:hypothetical protein